MPVHHLLEQILDEYIVTAGLQSGQPLFQSLNSLGTAVTGVSWLTFRRLAYLESLLILCAACQRVADEGRWMAFEMFVQSRDRTETTHGMCPDCQTALGQFAPESTE